MESVLKKIIPNISEKKNSSSLETSESYFSSPEIRWTWRELRPKFHAQKMYICLSYSPPPEVSGPIIVNANNTFRKFLFRIS